MQQTPNSKLYLIAGIAIILAFSIDRTINYYQNYKNITQKPQQNFTKGLLSVREVLNIIAQEVTISLNMDTVTLKKTLFNLWNFKIETSKQLKYTILATIQIGFEESDIIDPQTKQLKTRNFPPFRIIRTFLQFQKMDVLSHSYFENWKADQINKIIGYEARKDILQKIGSDPKIHQIVNNCNQKLNQIFYTSNNNENILPINLKLNTDSIHTSEFNIKQKK